MSRISNLLTRGSGTYYARMFVPVDLADRILKQEFLRSLRTKDQSKAAYRLGVYRAGIDRLFAMARTHPALDTKLLDLMERRIYARAVGRFTSARDYARLSDTQRTQARNDHADVVQILTQLLSSDDLDRHHNWVQTAYEGQFVSPNRDDPNYRQFAETGLSSPVTKSLFDQSVSGTTTMASIAGLPSKFATMAIAGATSD